MTREGEFGWAPIPDGDPSSMEIEATLIKQSDRVVGLDADDPDSAVKKQFFVDKFLEHHSKVLRLCEKQHRIYGDQRLTFRVAGIPEVIEYQTDQFGPETDVYVEYDVLNFDPETVDKKLDRLAGIAMMDKYGKIDQESLIEVAVSSVDPVMADAILRSKEQSTQKILEDVTNRLTAAYAGIDMGAGQGGAEIAMQAISSYVQQPDIAARLQQDEAFRQRVENIAKQYQFQIIQSQNAEIGRTGGTPATFDGVQS